MPVSVNNRAVQALAADLRRAAKNAPREIARATTDMARAAGTESKRAAAKVYAVKAGRIDQDITVTKGRGRVTVSGDRRPITALSYGARQTKRGLSFRVLKQGKRALLRRGFIAKNKGTPLVRVGKERLPVRLVAGPSVADMLANPKVQEPLIEKVSDRAVKTLSRRLGRLRG